MLSDGYAMLMRGLTRPNGCHCPGNLAVRMRKVMAIPRNLVPRAKFRREKPWERGCIPRSWCSSSMLHICSL